MAVIEQVGAREILDSRGNPTVEVEVVLDDGTLARAAVPSGASTGEHEAVELRDGDKARFGGKGVEKAVAAVLDEIGPELAGMEATDQRVIDQRLVDLDGTPDKGRLGANALLGVSLAVAKAAAESSGLELFRYVGGPNAHVLPVPMMNIINGGAHADSVGGCAGVHGGSDRRRSRSRRRCGGARRCITRSRVCSRVTGWPPGSVMRAGSPRICRGRPRRWTSIARAVDKAGFALGRDVVLALDVAATELFSDGVYSYEGRKLSSEEFAAVYAELVDAYPLVSIEDPLSEDDWEGWIALTSQIGGRGADRGG